MATDYDLLGSKEVLDELKKGRTRELLLLLQDKPVPEVVDPLNLQSGLSDGYDTDTNGDYIITGDTEGTSVTLPDLTNSDTESRKQGVAINPNINLDGVKATIDESVSGISKAYLQLDSDGSVLDSVNVNSGEQITLTSSLSSGTSYRLVVDAEGSGYTTAEEDVTYPFTSTDIDVTDGRYQDSDSGAETVFNISSVTALKTSSKLSAYVSDNFAAPTTPPADFKAWNAIRAEDVTTGGSTSANPVEFEILDSSDAVLNSQRIPKSEIADTTFRLRDREWTTTAAAGQTAFTIPETGAGGHYGIPILSVVTVEQNGSVLNGAWEFDGTDTVTLDSGASDGDTITISYDLDVFDSTLQPRAYLSREDTSEDSPSISHFRYEYVI